MKPKELMKRKKNTHKGESGHVLIIGGSEDYTGSLILAGLAALRSGCDIVTIACPEKNAWAINTYTPDLITKKLRGKELKPKHLKELKNLIEKADVLLIGNGSGTSKATAKFYKQLATETKEKLKVIDADAVKLLTLQEINNSVVTPHKKEFEVLLENSGIKSSDKEILKDNVILLKGSVDKVLTRKKTINIKGGNPGLAKAGTGDVLAGLTAGFLAQTNDKEKAVVTASKVNKSIGDLLLKKKKGYSFIASDMVEEINIVKKKFRL